jgi:hypothetical protein
MTHSIDEEARRRFEAAWQSRQKPRIEDFLPPESAKTYLPTLEELICIELELAWKRCGKDGGGPLVEGYWKRFQQLKVCVAGAVSAADEPPLPLRLILAEFEARRDFGDAPAAEEYRRRFPQWTEQKIHPALGAIFATALEQEHTVRHPPARERGDAPQRSLPDELVSDYRETSFLQRHRTLALCGVALLLVAIVTSIAAVLMSL